VDIAEVALLVAASVRGLWAPSEASIAPPPSDTDWTQVTVQVGGAAAATLVAAGVAVWWARRNHRDALAHDREMRLRDEVRSLLADAQEAMFDALEALRVLQSIQPLRAASQLEALAAVADQITGGPPPLRRADFMRSQNVSQRDVEFDAAVRRMHVKLVGLRLYPLNGPLVPAYERCMAALRSTANTLRQAPSDPDDASPALKEFEANRRKEVKRTRQAAHDHAAVFSAAAREYVMGGAREETHSVPSDYQHA
jgi:hypothetical protein